MWGGVKFSRLSSFSESSSALDAQFAHFLKSVMSRRSWCSCSFVSAADWSFDQLHQGSSPDLTETFYVYTQLQKSNQKVRCVNLFCIQTRIFDCTKLTSETPREPQTIMEEWTFWTNSKMPVWTSFMWCFLNSILISYPVFGMLYRGSYFMTFPFHRYPRKAFTPHSPYHFIVIEPRGGKEVSCKTWSIIVHHHHYQQWLPMTCESI